MKRIVLCLIRIMPALLVVSTLSAQAQNKTISGQITSADDGSALPGVSVYVKGNTAVGTTTDFDGKFTLETPSTATIVFSYIGYATQELPAASASVFNVVMQTEGTTLTDVVVVGTRNLNRSAGDTPVPVDVLDMKALSVSVPQLNINQILNYVAPSFTSNTQTVADGTDHLDPASLRGLGPDQVLVLINGKRRHTSALVNVNGSAGRGSVGTDLNAIPTQAIKRIEVLRDGAAAQYGSDAIAGVINIVLKDQSDGLDFSVSSGVNVGRNNNNFEGGADGEDVQVNANYGLPIGKNGGFINMTGSFYFRAPSSRAGYRTGNILNRYNAIEWQANKANEDLTLLQDDLGKVRLYAQNVPYFSTDLKNNINTADMATLRTLLAADATEDELRERGLHRGDFRMQVGQSALRSGQFFLNMAIPLQNGFEIYAFGGLSYRRGRSGGFSRLPNEARSVSAVYINGFLPHINTDVNDQSVAVGIRGKRREWNLDFSNTWGRNTFYYTIDNSLNASQLKATNTAFNSGGLEFMQNTANLDVSRFFKDALHGVNVAFGAEYRLENYKIVAGEESSYNTYYTNGDVSTRPDDARNVVDFFGTSRPGGAQVFPGFRPVNERNRYRHSVAAYIDVEADLSPSVLLEGAVRAENYSDFGGTINGKLAMRWKITNDITFRIAGNTGFRAPSLHQLNFNSTSTRFVGGVAYEVGNFSNDSRIAKLLGIRQLTAENSYSGSAGLAFGIPSIGMKITVDGYYTRINNRITLTGLFARPTTEEINTVSNNVARANALRELQRLFDDASANSANFFANSIDIDSKGVEAVINQANEFRPGFTLTNNLAVSWFQTRQTGGIHTPAAIESAGLTNTLFGYLDKTYLEVAQPNIKGNLSHELVFNRWSFFLRNSYFGGATDPGRLNSNTVVVSYSGKVLTDLSVGYSFNKHITLTIGSNNIFDVYPDHAPTALTNSNQFVYPRAISQFGYNGRYIFGRLTVSL